MSIWDNKYLMEEDYKELSIPVFCKALKKCMKDNEYTELVNVDLAHNIYQSQEYKNLLDYLDLSINVIRHFVYNFPEQLMEEMAKNGISMVKENTGKHFFSLYLDDKASYDKNSKTNHLLQMFIYMVNKNKQITVNTISVRDKQMLKLGSNLEWQKLFDSPIFWDEIEKHGIFAKFDENMDEIVTFTKNKKK